MTVSKFLRVVVKGGIQSTPTFEMRSIACEVDQKFDPEVDDIRAYEIVMGKCVAIWSHPNNTCLKCERYPERENHTICNECK